MGAYDRVQVNQWADTSISRAWALARDHIVKSQRLYTKCNCHLTVLQFDSNSNTIGVMPCLINSGQSIGAGISAVLVLPGFAKVPKHIVVHSTSSPWSSTFF